MNTELKPGMMALVIGGTTHFNNVGKTVELVKFIQEEERDSGGSKVRFACWEIKGKNLYSRMVHSITGVTVSEHHGDNGVAISKHLMPIKPQSDPLHTKEEQEVKA